MHTSAHRDWVKKFRMSHSIFAYLCSELWSSIERKDTLMRKAIPTDVRVAMAIWFLATGADYRTIGHLFGVSKATVFSVEECLFW